MAKVSFKTKRGKKIEFTATPGKKKGKRKLSTYNRFCAKFIKNRKKGTNVKVAMKQAAKAWKKKKAK
jgi:hypothetical protein